ncbi:MAG TPA: creatininase family protein [Candidatus Binataceae bacterium]|nr:creatininase family protein [Candidatus Binataceae bacterium]
MDTANSEIKPLRWETLTKRKFDELDRSRCVVLVTCSPIEVHGPHLPLGADALEGEGLLERTLQALPERHRDRTFLKLPFIYAAPDTVPQPGSLFFRPSTTVAVLEDLGRGLASQGFRDVLVSNFHGSPRHFLAIEEACDRISRECGIRMVCVFSVMLARLTNGKNDLYHVLGSVPGVDRENLIDDTHGGLVETSQLLALHPDWVDPNYSKLPRRTPELWLAENGEAPVKDRGAGLPGVFQMLKEIRSGLRFFCAETYSGAPGAASPEIGNQILGILAGRSAEAVAEILDGKLTPEQCHSPLWNRRFLFVNRWMVKFANWLLGVPAGAVRTQPASQDRISPSAVPPNAR